MTLLIPANLIGRGGLLKRLLMAAQIFELVIGPA
jgi:hypothetical protein